MCDIWDKEADHRCSSDVASERASAEEAFSGSYLLGVKAGQDSLLRELEVQVDSLEVGSSIRCGV